MGDIEQRLGRRSCSNVKFFKAVWWQRGETAGEDPLRGAEAPPPPLHPQGGGQSRGGEASSSARSAGLVLPADPRAGVSLMLRLWCTQAAHRLRVAAAWQVIADLQAVHRESGDPCSLRGKSPAGGHESKASASRPQ